MTWTGLTGAKGHSASVRDIIFVISFTFMMIFGKKVLVNRFEKFLKGGHFVYTTSTELRILSFLANFI